MKTCLHIVAFHIMLQAAKEIWKISHICWQRGQKQQFKYVCFSRATQNCWSSNSRTFSHTTDGVWSETFRNTLEHKNRKVEFLRVLLQSFWVICNRMLHDVYFTNSIWFWFLIKNSAALRYGSNPNFELILLSENSAESLTRNGKMCSQLSVCHSSNASE